ncbi:MAG: tRNA 2-selenouridine(34) synthase MnmH [Cyclobacteriaceae bacterium]
MRKLNVQDFLISAELNTIIDVRSPKEFDAGHIPGAINIPLFDDAERAEIGTIYKNEGKRKALLRGLDIVGPKMSGFVKQAANLSTNDRLLIHCWRGGMRSESFGWLLKTAGLEVEFLQGGYKAYRSHILKTLSLPLQLFLLTGSTGSGKTEILQHLKMKGEQVIDLEKLASHKGSVFGGMGQPDQPTTEQFQNYLFTTVSKLEAAERIWIEDESIAIGEAFIPEEFWNQMKNGRLIRIELDKSERVQRLVSEYGCSSKVDLKDKIMKVQKRLGGQYVKAALDHLEGGNLHAVADIVLKYYDKAYNNSLDRKSDKILKTLKFSRFDHDQMVSEILSAVENEELVQA